MSGSSQTALLLADGAATVTKKVDSLLDALGYTSAEGFLRPDRWSLAPEHAHTFRHAEAAARAPGLGGALRGVYVLRHSRAPGAATPVVVVCEAPNEQIADTLHRMVWNQGAAPFLLVGTPEGVRLYSGFEYHPSTKRAQQSGVLEACVAFHEAADRLAALRAENIDSGAVWARLGAKLKPKARVSERLLAELKKLGAHLRGSLSAETAHALIGRFIYLRYLHERGLLSDARVQGWGLDPTELFGQSITWESFQALVAGVDRWLNGSIFPVPKDAVVTDAQVQLVAGVLRGDKVDGQLHLDFRAYAFSHIPVALLSSIYEQFVDDEGRSEDQGAYYTPLPLVQFVLAELHALRPLRPGMRVLDPACGSGAFLVATYQLLVELHRHERGREPSAVELRELLTTSIFGVDQDAGACRVTELSLALALLDQLPDDALAPETGFQLPTLHKKNVLVGDFFDDALSLAADRTGFDWIIGNPPWAKAKAGVVGHRRALQWMNTKANKEEHPTCGGQLAQAFAWRASALLRRPDSTPGAEGGVSGGMAALIVPAMTLLESQGDFRAAFFTRLDVHVVANLTNLREVLFGGRARATAAALFFAPPAERASPDDVVVYSPLLLNQEGSHSADGGGRVETWKLTVDQSEVRVLSRADAAGDALPWKTSMWGSHRDLRLLRMVARRFPSLERFAGGKHRPAQGLELRPEPDKEVDPPNEGIAKPTLEVDPLEEVVGKLELDVDKLKGVSHIHHLPSFALTHVAAERGFVREGRSSPVQVCRPPHVIVSAARNFAVYSDTFIVVPPRQIGIPGEPGDEDLLRALALYLGSSFVRYHQFMMAPQSEQRQVSTLQNLKDLPIPLDPQDPASLKPWVTLHERAVALCERRWEVRTSVLKHPTNAAQALVAELETLAREVDELTYATLKLRPSERWLVEDFIQIKRPALLDGKVGEEAAGRPEEADLRAYAEALRDTLDQWLDRGERFRHQVTVLTEARAGAVQIGFMIQDRPHAVVLADASGEEAKALRSVREEIRAKHGQWLYFNRNLFQYMAERVFIHKPMQRFWWTRSRALADADRIIADMIAAGGAQ